MISARFVGLSSYTLLITPPHFLIHVLLRVFIEEHVLLAMQCESYTYLSATWGLIEESHYPSPDN